jgi:hypothetical protein
MKTAAEKAAYMHAWWKAHPHYTRDKMRERRRTQPSTYRNRSARPKSVNILGIRVKPDWMKVPR